MAARTRIWRVRKSVYKFLEHATGVWNLVFHMMVFGYVLLALALSSMLTLEDELNQTPLQRVVYYMEISLAVYFTAEFLLRLWAVGADARYQGCYGRLRFLRRFVCLVDLTILCATVLLLSIGHTEMFSPGMVQHVRLMQIFRLLHFDRQMATFRLIRDMIRMSRFELVSAYYITFLFFLSLSASVFIAESYNDAKLIEDDPETKPTFRSYGDAMWFSIISLMTVGYGDIVPRAWPSKIVTCVLGFCAFCMFTTSSTLVGVGLTLMVQDSNKQKMRQKVRAHAARLLQTWYRRHLLSTKKFEHIAYFRQNLFRKLYMYEKIICKPAAEAAELLQQQQKLKNARRPSALTQNLLKRIRHSDQKRGSHDIRLELGMSMLSNSPLLQHSDISITPVCEALHDRLTPPSTHLTVDAPVRKLSLVDRMSMSTKQATHLTAEAPVRKFSLVDRMSMMNIRNVMGIDKDPPPTEFGRSASNTQFYYNSGPSSTSSATKEPPKLHKSEPRPGTFGHRMRHETQSADAEADKRYGSDTPTPNRSRANSVDTVSRSRRTSFLSTTTTLLVDDWNEECLNDRTIRKYCILMQFIYYLRFLANKSRFNRARKPFELKDIETELHEMELQRMAKLKELQVSVEAAMGTPLQSILSTDKGRQHSFANRLDLCEKKLVDIERNAAMVLHLADMIARQIAPPDVAPSIKLTTPAQRTRLLQRKKAFLVKSETIEVP